MKKFLVLLVLCITLGLVGCSNAKDTTQPSNANTKNASSTSGAQADDKGAVISVSESAQGELDEISTSMIETLVQVGYSVEQASGIQKILNTVGVICIEVYGSGGAGTATEGLYSMVCYPNGYTDRDRRFNFTTEDGVLFYAGFLNEDLYDTSKGGFLKAYADIHVPETEISLETYSELQILAVEAVKSYLNYSSSADFDAFGWGVGRSDDKYKVQGKVSAKNGFGVKDDLYFGVWFVARENDFDIEGIVIDGTRVR